jgi:predicted metal-dependent hydrolase
MKTRQITYKNQLIKYVIQTRARVTRNIHLQTGPDGGLVVVAPKRTSHRAIHRTLQDMAPKVSRYLMVARARLDDLIPLHYRHGEEHLFLGVRYPLDLINSGRKRGSVHLVENRAVINDPDIGPEQVRKRLQKWYREQATEYLSARLQSIAQKAPWTNGVTPIMRIRRMKRTWGNCSAKKVITFNLHLVKAPADVIDYVVAHELCHLVEMNHGSAFYALQTQLNPDWRAHRAELRARGHIYLHE